MGKEGHMVIPWEWVIYDQAEELKEWWNRANDKMSTGTKMLSQGIK